MNLIKTSGKNAEKIVLSIIVAIRILYFSMLQVDYHPDSYEYMSVDGFKIFEGLLDRYRLPLYPLLIDLFGKIFGEQNIYALCVFQLIVSLISIVVLYFALKKVIGNKYIVLFSTALYSLFCGVIGWDKTVLTESLALSFAVFILFGLISYIKEQKPVYICFVSFFVIAGALLKSVFAIYAAFIFAFLVLFVFCCKNKERAVRRANIICSVISVVPIIVVLLYANAFSQQFGSFTVSDTALGNELYIVLQEGYYKDSGDEELIQVADEILYKASEDEVDKAITDMMNTLYGGKEADAAAVSQITQAVRQYHSDIILENKYETNIRNILKAMYSYEEYTCADFPRLYLARIYLMENYDTQRVSEFVSKAKSSNSGGYAIHGMIGITEYFDSYFQEAHGDFVGGYYLFSSLLFVFHLSLLHCLAIAYIDLFAIFYGLSKRHRVNWIRLGLCVFVFATVILSLTKATAEYARTAITALPFTFVSLGMDINAFCAFRRKSKSAGNKTHRLDR